VADIFISYARATAQAAELACAALRRAGYSVWFDAELQLHRAYTHQIEEQLAEARAVLVLWSADATRSEWVLSEANRAREERKLVQATLEPVRLPMPFDQLQCADLLNWRGEADARGWQSALATIATLVSQTTPTPITPRPPSHQNRPRESERRHLTFLSAGIAGGAGLAAGLDPEDWHAVLSGWKAAAAPILARFDGQPSWTADTLTAHFGWPVAHEDAAERAVRAALALATEAQAVAARFRAILPGGFRVQLAVHNGTMLVTPAADDRVEFVGDAPEVAALARAAAPPDGLVVTDTLRQLVEARFQLEPLATAAAAGGPLFRVAGLREESAVPRAWHGTRLYGREDEMLLLGSRWRRAVEGEGQYVLVRGDPGIGKSRLVAEFRASLAGKPHGWIDLAGTSLSLNTPYHPVTTMLRRVIDERGGDPLEALTAMIAPSGAGAEGLALVAEMLGIPGAATDEVVSLSPDQRRRRLLGVLAEWLFARTRTTPLVLAVEDLHWVDPSTLELVQMLADQAASEPLLLLATSRSEFRPGWPERSHYSTLSLGRLSAKQTRELAAEALGEGADAELLEAVIKRADGVPLFAEELARLLAERRGEAGAAIPATLRDSLAARLDRLGPAREYAQIGSVLGREFGFPLLLAVSGEDEAMLEEGLDQLVDAELLQVRGSPPRASYQFRHALLQDTAYEMLTRGRRRELHGRAARAIAEQFPAIAENQPEVVAIHLTRAGEQAPAIAAWDTAAQAAYGRRAFREAESHYRQALDVLAAMPEGPERDDRELELLSGLNRVLQLTHGYAGRETVVAAERAKALAEKSGNLVKLIREEARVWRALIVQGDYAGCTALADHILDLSRQEGENPGRMIFAYNAQVQTRYYTGDFPGVERYFPLLEPLIATAEMKQAPGNNGVALGIGALTAALFGRQEEADRRIAASFAFAETSQNPYDLCMALHFRALLCNQRNDLPCATEAATRLRAVAQENDFSYMYALAGLTLGRARSAAGDPEGGIAELRAAIDALTAVGARLGVASVLARVAEAQLKLGDPAAAVQTARRALQLNPLERVYHPDAGQVLARALLAVGDRDAARETLRTALADAADMGAIAIELPPALDLARLLAEDGDPAAARALLAPLLARLEGDLSVGGDAEARAFLAGLAA
jgi:class 3 adenylate cyclase/tetratricopeptide (TPR) repeat protein